jgi:hypothetical protein
LEINEIEKRKWSEVEIVKRGKKKRKKESNGSYRGGNCHVKANVRVKRSFRFRASKMAQPIQTR